MTETLNRTPPSSSLPPRRPTPERPARSSLGLGAAAALWAAMVGLLCLTLPVLLLWAVDDRSGVGAAQATRTAGRLWLVAHGVSLDLPDGRFALTPIGLLLLPLVLVTRFAASAARDARPSGTGPAMRLTLWVAAPYSVLALLVAVLCTGPDVHVSPVQSMVGGYLVGVVGAGLGVARPGRLWRTTWHALAARTRRLLTACAAALALLLGAGALLVAGSLVTHFPQAVELAGASAPGAVGGAGLLLACLALAPNAVVWAISWLAGPGFAVGAGTAVGPFAHELGPVPAVPLLAALPSGGVPTWAGVLVLAVPLLAGAVAGCGLAQASAADSACEVAGDLPSRRRTAAEAGIVGPLCGLVVGLLAWISGGPAGGERLVELGPGSWSVGLALSGTVGAGAVAGALVQRRRLVGRSRPED